MKTRSPFIGRIVYFLFPLVDLFVFIRTISLFQSLSLSPDNSSDIIPVAQRIYW